MVLPPKEDWGNWWEVFVAAVIGGTVAFSGGGRRGGFDSLQYQGGKFCTSKKFPSTFPVISECLLDIHIGEKAFYDVVQKKHEVFFNLKIN